MTKLTWIGDSDPEAQSVTQDGITFVKGVATPVDDKDVFKRLSGNPMFSADAKAEPVEADEVAPVDPDEGTEKGAIKRRLRDDFGVSMQGNPSLETLRTRLAAEVAKQD